MRDSHRGNNHRGGFNNGSGNRGGFRGGRGGRGIHGEPFRGSFRGSKLNSI